MTSDALEARRERRRRELARRRRWALVAAIAAVVGVGVVAWSALPRTPTRPGMVARIVRITHQRQMARAGPVVRLALPEPLPRRALTIPIVMYHRIDVLRPSLPLMTRALTVSPDDFARQMRWLQTHGFHAVSQLQVFAALERGAPLPAHPVMITFDDGYRDVLTNAAPVLARLHMPATAYVITGRISGSDPSFLTWNELKRLERDGVTVGSHTVHHLELPALTDAVALHELVASRIALERRLGHPVQWFAYPAGAENAHAAYLVRRAGYILAVTTHPGTLQNAAFPLELKRDEILDSTGVAGLAALAH